MNKTTPLLIGIFLIIIFAGGVFGLHFFSGNTVERPDEHTVPRDAGGGSVTHDPLSDVVIRRTEIGFEPGAIEISVGTTVSWINETDSFFWPASDVHPTHQDYPGNQTGSGCGAGTFDPCEPIAPDEVWSFTFDEPGVWGVHDHLRANVTGTIRVVESSK